jgi:uncharacterized protein
MLMVKTKLGMSAIEGVGIFADEDIPKGTVTWRFMTGFDQTFNNGDLARLPETARLEMLRYVYLHSGTGRYVFCLDNARFMNHASDPNTAGVYPGPEAEDYDIATRDIAKGEELTCDYAVFDAETDVKLGLPSSPGK